MLICSGIEFLLIREHLIPEIPTAVKGLIHNRRLLRRGVDTHLDRGVLQCAALADGILIPLKAHSRTPQSVNGTILSSCFLKISRTSSDAIDRVFPVT